MLRDPLVIFTLAVFGFEALIFAGISLREAIKSWRSRPDGKRPRFMVK